MVLKKYLILTIIMVLFMVGCGKQVQEEIPVEKIPIKEPDVMEEEEPAPIVEEEVPAGEIEPEPLEFVSDMECVNGRFNFTVTNVGVENFTTTKATMHIKAKLFRMICDDEVVAPGNSTGCTQSYYSSIIGGAPVKIQAKIGKQLETYFETVDCGGK